MEEGCVCEREKVCVWGREREGKPTFDLHTVVCVCVCVALVDHWLAPSQDIIMSSTLGIHCYFHSGFFPAIYNSRLKWDSFSLKPDLCSNFAVHTCNRKFYTAHTYFRVCWDFIDRLLLRPVWEAWGWWNGQRCLPHRWPDLVSLCLSPQQWGMHMINRLVFYPHQIPRSLPNPAPATLRRRAAAMYRTFKKSLRACLLSEKAMSKPRCLFVCVCI